MVLASPPVKVRVDLSYAAAWNDISTYVYWRDAIQIGRGTPSEATSADPSSIGLTLDNRDFRFCSRNPSSPLFGVIGRNTPIRVRAGLRLSDNKGLCLPQEVTTDFIVTPDNAALDIVGDIDIAVEFTAFNVTTATQCLIAKGTTGGVTGTQLSYQVLLGVTAGVPHVTLRWSTDGTTVKFVDHNMAALSAYKHMAIRVTLDVDNGAGGNTASFYTSSDGTISGTWNLDGSTTVTAGTTSIFSGTGIVVIGAQSDSTNPFRGLIVAALVKNGIGGTAVANPVFSAQSSTFVDAAGRTWTLNNGAYLDYYLHTRMVGEVSSWPQLRDTSGNDVYTQITAGGILRRLQQGQNVPATDAMATYLAGSSASAAFVGATTFDTTGKKTLGAVGTVNSTFGAGDLGLGAKVMLITTTGQARDGNGYLTTGYLNADISTLDTSHFGTGLTFQADIGRLGDISLIVTSFDDGVVSREFELQIFGAFGLVTLLERAYNRSTLAFTPTTLLSVANAAMTGPTGTNYGDGLKHTAYLTLDQSGGNVAWQVYIDGVSVGSGSISTMNLETLWQLHLAYDPVAGGDVNVGYLGAWGGAAVPSAAAYTLPATGYLGETAGARITRLATADSIGVSVTGSAGTILMGAQSSKGVLALMQEAAVSDGGYLADTRAAIAIAYVGRASFYNQTAQAVLDYSTHIFDGDPAPTDDDLNVHNDVTASNSTGASVEKMLTTGALSTQAPPNGINQYPSSVSVNVASDGFLGDIAGWALALGTIDRPRWPSLPLNMLNQHLTTQLYNQLADAALTNLIQITNAPLPLPPDTINLQLLGDSEVIAQDQWTLKWNLAPADVYQSIGVYAAAAGSATTKFDAETSTVGTLFNTSATSISILSAANTQPWVTTAANAAEFPFDINIGGERMTVTAIVNAASPQTFTVTRSVNGIVKAHAVGEPVHLWTTYRFGL